MEKNKRPFALANGGSQGAESALSRLKAAVLIPRPKRLRIM